MKLLLRNHALRLVALSLGLAVAACSQQTEAAIGTDAQTMQPLALDTPTGEAGPEIVVYKTPTCGCCTDWEDHLVEHGFTVKSVVQNDLRMAKQVHGVPPTMQSCHTGVVEGYTIEGHVPAAVIRKLLAERPAVQGIAVPGMPIGSPGMEHPSGHVDPYEVYTFDENGPKEVYVFVNQ
jgi:hypothetical protein